MFESFPYLFIIPKETDVKSHEPILDHILVYISLVFKLQELSGPVYLLSVNSHCIAETLLFRRRKKASYSELDSLFNADQSQGYFEVYP